MPYVCMGCAERLEAIADPDPNPEAEGSCYSCALYLSPEDKIFRMRFPRESGYAQLAHQAIDAFEQLNKRFKNGVFSIEVSRNEDGIPEFTLRRDP